MRYLRDSGGDNKDLVLVKLTKCIAEGWKTGTCPGYANYKTELWVDRGMIMKSNRVVVPSTMRQEMLGRIH